MHSKRFFTVFFQTLGLDSWKSLSMLGASTALLGTLYFTHASTPAPVIHEPAAEVAALDTKLQKEAVSPYPMNVELQVNSGDTLINLLTDTGVEYQEAHELVAEVKKVYNPRGLNIGQKLIVELDSRKDNPDKPTINAVEMPISPVTTLHISRNEKNGEFEVEKENAKIHKKLATGGGVIDSSIYETALKSGMSSAMVAQMIQAFSYDVDFQRDVKEGNRLKAVYERMETAEGRRVAGGALLYAELELNKRTVRVYRYTDKAGNGDFYNEKGESIRKALLRTPLNGAKITSKFGMRNHPVLGYTRMHKGVDFGAATGTPIYAAGDGKIAFAGRKGGYGNYIQLKHNTSYATAYGHMSRFAAGMRQGAAVKQGQIIGYVGMTGTATGPHLHYEVLVNNAQVNPAGVKFKTGNMLAGNDLKQFKSQQSQVLALLGSPSTVAQNTSKSATSN